MILNLPTDMMRKQLFGALLFMILLQACGETPTQPIDDIPGGSIPEIAEVSQQIAANPNSSNLYGTRSLLYTQHEMFKEAVEDAERAQKLDTANIDLYRLLANAYFDNDQTRPAIKILLEAIEKWGVGLEIVNTGSNMVSEIAAEVIEFRLIAFFGNECRFFQSDDVSRHFHNSEPKPFI